MIIVEALDRKNPKTQNIFEPLSTEDKSSQTY